MPELRGFEPHFPRGVGPGPTNASDLPFVRVFPEAGDRLPPGAWKFYNDASALGAVWAWVGLVGCAALVVASVGYSFTDRGSNDNTIWKVVVFGLAGLALSSFVIHRSILRLRRLVRTAVVVPARVERVAGGLPNEPSNVDFTFDLYGNVHPVTIPVPRGAAKLLSAGDRVHLVADPSSDPIVCFYLPRTTERALLLAAHATAAAPAVAAPEAAATIPPPSTDSLDRSFDELLDASIAAPPDAAQVIELRYTLTPEERAELSAAIMVTPPGTRGADWRMTAIGSTTFVLGMGALVLASLASHGDGPALFGWPLRGAAWANYVGGALVAAGVVGLFWGGRADQRSIGTSGALTFRSDESGVTFAGDHAEQQSGWAAFNRHVETIHLYVLARPGAFGYAVPKRAFPSEATRRAFAERLARHLPRAKEVAAPWKN